jgi:hypothetical protein
MLLQLANRSKGVDFCFQRRKFGPKLHLLHVQTRLQPNDIEMKLRVGAVQQPIVAMQLRVVVMQTLRVRPRRTRGAARSLGAGKRSRDALMLPAAGGSCQTIHFRFERV